MRACPRCSTLSERAASIELRGLSWCRCDNCWELFELDAGASEDVTPSAMTRGRLGARWDDGALPAPLPLQAELLALTLPPSPHNPANDTRPVRPLGASLDLRMLAVRVALDLGVLVVVALATTGVALAVGSRGNAEPSGSASPTGATPADIVFSPLRPCP